MAAFHILFSISAEAKSWTPEQIKQIIIEESLKSETVPPSLALAIAIDLIKPKKKSTY
jgi:hypothetical protein